jgi:protein-disulfide isomerase
MSKRSEARKRRHQKKQRQELTFGLVALGVILIIASIVFLPSLQPVGEIITPEFIEHPMANGSAIGDPNAPVVMEEYSDYQCTYCRKFSEETEPLLIEQYVVTGKLYIIFKNFVIYESPGYSSIPFAEAALCAADQNKFWDYHDILYANQSTSDSDKYSESRLEAYAEIVGLDLDAFKQCLGDSRTLEEIRRIQLEAGNLEINSTPTFLINGKMIVGAQPLEVFQQEIETALTGR